MKIKLWCWFGQGVGLSQWLMTRQGSNYISTVPWFQDDDKLSTSFWWKWSNQTPTEVRHLKDQSSLTEVSRTQSSIMISWLHLQEWPTSRQWRTIPDPTELLTQPLTQVFISWSRAEPLRPHSPWRASVWPLPSAERWGLMSRWRGLVIRLERQVGWGTWLIGDITY